VIDKLKTYIEDRFMPKWLILAVDMLIVTSAFLYTYFLRYNLFAIPVPLAEMLLQVLAGAPFFILATIWFRPYVGVVRHSTVEDALILVKAHAVFSGGLALISFFGHYVSQPLSIPYSIIIIHFFVSLFSLIMLRFGVHLIYTAMYKRSVRNVHVMIYGAGKLGRIALNVISSDRKLNYSVVGFIDDNPDLWGKKISGLEIFSPGAAFSKIVSRLKVREIILAIENSQITIERKNEIVEKCLENHLKVKDVPDATSWMSGTMFSQQIRNVRIEDLLGRSPIDRNPEVVLKCIRGRKVMVTGGAGSIGSEIVRQLVYLEPSCIMIVDQAESALYDIQNEILPLLNNTELRIYVANITNILKMGRIFENNPPDIIFHAAAYKHVPMMEAQPYTAIYNNVGGTKVLSELAIKHGVDKFVMVSTDKAVNPTNIMGTTKRMCEIYIQSLSELVPSKTRFITTRFGNVLGSNGSVIPLFRNQIAQGGPVTVTHREIIRYFMTIPEACQLVLEAGFMGKGGEIFIFDMGKPVRIYDLAEKMISLSGYVPDKDIKIVETGLRPGEKLFEELLANHEENLPTVHKRIMVARMRPMDYVSAKQEIEQLLKGLEEMDELEIVKSMKRIVPEYVSENSRYMELDTAERQEQISGEAPVIVKKRRLFKK
jgi:FlaA1/EpsC-like NDP-sugar epimerase